MNGKDFLNALADVLGDDLIPLSAQAVTIRAEVNGEVTIEVRSVVREARQGSRITEVLKSVTTRWVPESVDDSL